MYSLRSSVLIYFYYQSAGIDAREMREFFTIFKAFRPYRKGQNWGIYEKYTGPEKCKIREAPFPW